MNPTSNRYVGEIISEAEAEMRQNDAYLFSLDDKVIHMLRQKYFCENVKNTFWWKLLTLSFYLAGFYSWLFTHGIFSRLSLAFILLHSLKIFTALMPVSMETSVASLITCVSPTCLPVECSQRTRTFVFHTSPFLLVKTSRLERSLGIYFIIILSWVAIFFYLLCYK